MTAPYETLAVEHLGGFRLRLTLADGLVGDVDLSDRLRAPVGATFEALQDAEYFSRVAIDSELGTVVWPNGADVAPDTLHAQVGSLA